MRHFGLKTLGLCLLGVIFCLIAIPGRSPWVLRPPWRVTGAMDATAFRTGAELVGTRALYQPESVAVVQDRNVGTSATLRLFIRPPWYAFLLRWMAYIPYERAMVVWKILVAVACVLFVLIWPSNRTHAALAMAWSLPAVAALEQGQDTPWFLVLLAVSIHLLRQRLDTIAGITLSLSTFKFHFLILLPIVVLVHRKWRLAIGFCAGIACLAAISFIVQGMSWPYDYYRLLSAEETRALSPIVPGVEGLVWPLPLKDFVYVLAGLAIAICVWKISWLWPLEVAIAASVAGALLISPHAYIQDTMVLIPLALQVVAFKGQFQRLALWLLSPIAAYPLAWWLPIIGPAFLAVPAYKLLVEMAAVGKQPKPEKSLVA